MENLDNGDADNRGFTVPNILYMSSPNNADSP